MRAVPVPSDDAPPTDVHDARSVAVLLPCRNEEVTIGKVVHDFRRVMPQATVYVYDNASTDRTAEVARTAGAIVRHAPLPGKGNVVRQMFAEVDAAAYVLADGDDTYDAGTASLMVSKLRDEDLAMVVGNRVEADDAHQPYRAGHRLGNQFLSGTVRWLFGAGSTDMLSGYRAFSRSYVESFPATSEGFEVETEMTVHALRRGLACGEVPTEYRDRPHGSRSKLRTFPDGLRILRFVLVRWKEYHPIRFFGSVAAAAMALVLAAVLGVSEGGLVGWAPLAPRLAGLSLISGLVVGALCLVTGILRESLRRRRMTGLAELGQSPTAGLVEL